MSLEFQYTYLQSPDKPVAVSVVADGHLVDHFPPVELEESKVSIPSLKTAFLRSVLVTGSETPDAISTLRDISRKQLPGLGCS